MDKKTTYFALSPKFASFLKIRYEAEKMNIAKAQFELALLYITSKNESTATKAVYLLKKAANQKHMKAGIALGRCYEKGFGVKRSYKQAIGWYKKAYHQVSAALMDAPDKAYDAVREYLQSTDFEELSDEEAEKEDSFEFDEEAAERGDAQAQNRLGHRYYYGRNTEKNYEHAIYWYHKSARQGCEAAMGRLAEYYESEKNYKESAKWYCRYADKRVKWYDKRR